MINKSTKQVKKTTGYQIRAKVKIDQQNGVFFFVVFLQD